MGRCEASVTDEPTTLKKTTRPHKRANWKIMLKKRRTTTSPHEMINRKKKHEML